MPIGREHTLHAASLGNRPGLSAGFKNGPSHHLVIEKYGRPRAIVRGRNCRMLRDKGL
jgi:hypothetical protein